ncbi:DUF2567 domain-containing protein [Gordonia sp. 'Campus']|uniref:DUF2567 domain-containing protein n=1 Tax=Gordonia sp. 'Campus' TaxID=2915824 RepID=UPI001EE3CE1A|nr:DUF2567 domain-containing protein [Gordonia sp. 'Campus']
MTVPDGPQHQELDTGSPRRLDRPLSRLIAVALGVVALGAVAGIIWGLLTPASTGIVVEGLRRDDVSTDFGGVGAFALVMFAYGGIAALVVWFAARAWRGVSGFVWPVLASTAGGALAAAVGMWVAGLRFHDDPASMPVEAVYRVAPELWLDGGTRSGPSDPWTLLICAPFAFAVVYLVCVLSSRTADLGVGDLDEVDWSSSDVTSADAASRTRP